MATSAPDRSARVSLPPASVLPFDERACFVAGPARSGTTLITALLDGHPDLLVLLLETYAGLVGRAPESTRRWVEKTPANRDHLPAIFERFPHAKVLLTIRDPRALLASQIQLEQTRRRRRFSVYLTIRHWLTTARLALALQDVALADPRFHLVEYQRLIETPRAVLQEIVDFLEIDHDPASPTPTKMGFPWSGNSAAGQTFDAISAEPVHRWRKFLTAREIGWVEWHCRPWMERLGYEPLFARRQFAAWIAPLRGETPREYLKSRLYSLSGRWKQFETPNGGLLQRFK